MYFFFSCVAQASLELMILLPQPSEISDYKYADYTFPTPRNFLNLMALY